MSLSELFIRRPIATLLLTFGILLGGALAFQFLPVAPLPQVDYPTISVNARLPGASAEVMAATVATPLERTLGRIAGVTEITSESALGSTSVTIQFDLDRDINGAARDVQGAINAARALLPSGMPSPPTYRKVNPGDAPIMILALTSKTLTLPKVYDSADSILAQKLAQISGIGSVSVGGSSPPAVRVEVNPSLLAANGVGFDQVRQAITTTNANRPKGFMHDGQSQWQIGANDQAKVAADYRDVIVSYKDMRPLRLSQVATVKDSVQDVRNAGYYNGQRAVTILLFRQPGANIIETVERVKAALPQMRSMMPSDVKVEVVMDRTPTIRASLYEVERSLVISVLLVIFVVFLFLGNGRATLIPAITVPVSLIGTFGVMYLLGFSLNNLSLMALTIATGFVVDDAIVVLENTARHIEAGMSPQKAARRGAEEVGFTVLSMSISLIAVFFPVLFMGGILGRLFREFAVTLSVAIFLSLIVSLTLAPMLCSRVLKAKNDHAPHPFIGWLMEAYRDGLSWCVRHKGLMLGVFFGVLALNVYLYMTIAKGFFPQQDTGRIMGSIRADQTASFQMMPDRLEKLIAIVRSDPAVKTVVAFSGGSSVNTGRMFVMLKPKPERKETSDQVIGRLRKKVGKIPGVSLNFQSVQDIRIGARPGAAQYQFTLQAMSLEDLRKWSPIIAQELRQVPEITDIDKDDDSGGLQTVLTFDKDEMARLGITQASVDSTLNSAFGQRQVSTIYNPLNQYKVVLTVDQAYQQGPQSLDFIQVPIAGGRTVPLSAIAKWAPGRAPLSVNHQSQFPASTISFNLSQGVSLSEAGAAILDAINRSGAPSTITGSFQGTAKAFNDSLASQPFLILAAILAVYIVLGILYESWIHPITILSTLPSAGVGALVALIIFHNEFNVIGLVGVLLLIGIVKKNAIMMIDFALVAERERGLSAKDAIIEASLLRFRPIMMTTGAAMFGALPLVFNTGDGGELRQPLGIAIVGGLLVSQLMTLFSTPVVYLVMDRFRRKPVTLPPSSGTSESVLGEA